MKSDVTKAAEDFTAKEALAVAAEAAAQEAWISWQADGGDPWPVAVAVMASHVAAAVAVDAKRDLEWAERALSLGEAEIRWNAIAASAREVRSASLQWATVQRQDGQETEEFLTRKAAWLLAAAEAKAAIEALDAQEAKDST